MSARARICCHTPTSPNRETVYLHEHADERLQNRFLTEGVCPNRCGPLSRVGERVALCACCGFTWVSARVVTVFPARTKGAA